MTAFRLVPMLWACAAACAFVAGDEPPRGKAPPRADAGEHRDAILLLGRGPLHVRLHISLAGKSLAESRHEYAERLLQSLDANGDGKLTRSEAAKSPLLRTKQREGVVKGLGLSEVPINMDKIEQTIEVKGGQLVSYRQNGSAAAPDQEVFKFLDKNSDGVIDVNEIASAAERLSQKDEDRDQCVTFDEFSPPPPPPDPTQVVMRTPAKPTTTKADLIRDLGDPQLARRLLQQYDRDRNKKLSALEIGWNADRVALLDKNGDQLLDEQELAEIKSSPVDLELTVDLAPGDGQQPAIRVLTTGAERLDNQDRPDFAKVRFRDAVISVSHRQIDPFAKAMETAMREFNRFDVDNNGYLDRSEVKDTIRLEHGLFELMDADNDGKVFGDEMKQYVAGVAEPRAMSCEVNLFDTGFGFFLALDRNGDGRISERERRSLHTSLAQLNRDGKPGITAQEPVRHFHLELVRGTFTLFGAPEQVAVQTPAFQRRPPIGPSWFQAMDRNNDGDLSWEEFFDSRQMFDHIDADHDSLIDPHEAATAEEEYEHAKPQLTHK